MEMNRRIHYCEGNNNKNSNDDDEIIMMQLEYLQHKSDRYFVNYLAMLSMLVVSAVAGYLCPEGWKFILAKASTSHDISHHRTSCKELKKSRNNNLVFNELSLLPGQTGSIYRFLGSRDCDYSREISKRQFDMDSFHLGTFLRVC